MQFLQEVTNPSVPVVPACHSFLLHVILSQWWHRPFDIKYFYAVDIDAYFNGVTIVPSLMEHRIAENLLQCVIRIVVHSYRFCLIMYFNHFLRHHLRFQIIQCLFQLALLLVFLAYMDRSLIRTQFATRHPNYYEHLPHVLHRFRKHVYYRLYHIANLHQFFLNSVYAFQFNPNWRQNRYSVLLFYANHNISSSPIVNVVGKCTDGMQNVHRVPATLEIKAFPFHYLPADKLLYIYW